MWAHISELPSNISTMDHIQSNLFAMIDRNIKKTCTKLCQNTLFLTIDLNGLLKYSKKVYTVCPGSNDPPEKNI